jgi:hypothetical protein
MTETRAEFKICVWGCLVAKYLKSETNYVRYILNTFKLIKQKFEENKFSTSAVSAVSGGLSHSSQLHHGAHSVGYK